MFDVVLTLLLGVHLLLVDVAMAGPLVCVGLEWYQSRRGLPRNEIWPRRLATISLAALVAGGMLGGVLLAIRWWRQDVYLSALGAIPTDRLVFAAIEFVFSLVCVTAYVACWSALANWKVFHRLLALAAATNLLVHFPALFTIASLLATRTDPAETIDRATFRGLLVDRQVLPQVVHIWVAAFAVTGALLAALATRPEGDESSSRAARVGVWLALVATALQLPVGLWVALAMPEGSLGALMGNDLAASLLFAAALALALYLLHALAGLALGDFQARGSLRPLVIMVLVVVLMVAARRRLGDAPTLAGLASGGGKASIGSHESSPLSP